MQYLGGKARIAKELAEYLEEVRERDQPYVEPFVGAAWVLERMKGTRQAYDVNPFLIALYQALQKGWLPPMEISEDNYQWAKYGVGIIPELRAFIGFGCSFGGKFFGGYARSGERNYASNARNSLLKQLPKIQDVCFECSDYNALHPVGSLVYCDPPYEATTGYSETPTFSWSNFWNTMRVWSKSNTVLISGYTCPDDFCVVWEKNTRTDMRDKSGCMSLRVERLFRYRGGIHG